MTTNLGRACLGDETIAMMLEGGLADSAAHEARAHLAGCVECRKLVAAAVEHDPVDAGATIRDVIRHPGELGPGVVLGQRFRIERVLGEGGMGRVFVATQLGLGRAVAIKVLRSELVGDSQALSRFRREARVLASLENPHVIRVFDIGELGDGTPYLVMELLEGEDLGAMVARSPVSPEQAVRWLIDVCSGLGEAHALGIVHRDLKPSNLFITRHGRIVILDFGLAKLVGGSSMSSTLGGAGHRPSAALTSVGMLLGSPHYMSPEQAMGAGLATVGTDIWALGATLVHLVTGRPPFPAATLEAVLAAIVSGDRPNLAGMPTALATIAHRAMAMDPGQRHASVAELAADLHGSLFKRPEVPRPTVATPPVRPRGRGRWIALACLGGVLAVATLAAVALQDDGSPTASPPTTPLVTAPVSVVPAPSAPAPPDAVAAPRPLAAIVDEDYVLGLYVICFERLDVAVRRTWETYTAFADPQGGPDVGRARAPGPIEEFALRGCRDALDGTRDLEALAVPTRTYREALEAVVTAVAAADEHYRSANASDVAAARRIHAELQGAFGAFDAADVSLRTAWWERHSARSAIRLSELARSHGPTSELYVTEQVLKAADAVVLGPARASSVLALEEACADLGRVFGDNSSADTDRAQFDSRARELLAAAKANARAPLVAAYDRLVETSNAITWTTAREQRASARPRLRASERLVPPPAGAPVPRPTAAAITAATYDEAAVRARFTALGWTVDAVTKDQFPGCIHTDVRATRVGQGATIRMLDCETETHARAEAARLERMANHVVRRDGTHVIVFAAWGGGLATMDEGRELARSFLLP